MPTDPVCGMFVPDTSTLRLSKEGKEYFFCSRECLNSFKSPEEQMRAIRKRLTLAWALTLPILVITYLDFIPYRLYILFLLALPVQFYSGLGFYTGAYEALKNKMGNMDILISLGTLTAFIYSAFITFVPDAIPNSGIYFDASVFIITMILTGNYIETFTKKSAGDAANSLMQLLPSTVHKLEDGSQVDIPADTLKVGDSIVVRAGEVIFADGRVVGGQGDIDTSTLTGEQSPEFVSEGGRVLSGTRNLNGTLTVEIDKVGSNSTIGRIHEMLLAASSGRAKIQRMADIFSTYFVPVVLAAASVSAIVWLIIISGLGTADWSIPVLAFVSVVVIACPCAIGLAAPISLMVSSSFSFKNGLILKNTSVLDRLSKVDMVIFDKTGTLTEVIPAVSSVKSEMDEGEMMKLAASVEINSNHPVARSIVSYVKSSGIDITTASDVIETAGKGISGTVEGVNVELRRSSETENSGVVVITDGKPVGHISFVYRVRDGAPELVKNLKKLGIQTAMVTGDRQAEAERISALLSLDHVHYEVLPEDKAKIVMDYQQQGHYVLFVGDGINDAVALETADAGIAVADSSDIAKEAGDLILTKNDISLVQSSITLSRETLRKVRQNIYWAMGYNSALIPVAGGIFVPIFGLQMFTILPMLAALAMGFSSTSVVLNSLLLRPRLRKNVFGAAPS